MKRVLFSVLCFLPFLASAQNLTVSWVNAIGGAAGDEIIQSTVVDASGNVYISGSFKGTVNFNPNGTASNLTSVGLSDAFFAKYTSAGLLVWVKQLGAGGSDEVYAMTVDGSGNVYIAGYFNGTVDFDPNAAVANLTAAGSDDIFFGKYSSAGTLTWANAHGSTGIDAALAIKVDPAGSVYVTGYFNGTVDFDPSNTVTNNKTSVGSDDIFLGKFSSAGALTWIDTFGSSASDIGYSIDLDNSSIYITGYYSATIDLDPGTGLSNTTNIGGTDAFFSKYDLSTGALAWWATVRSAGNDEGTSIVVSGANFYLGGVFSSSANFYSLGGTVTKVSNGGTDIFIAKYDGATSLPTLTWVNQIGGLLDERSNLLTLDGSTNVYSTGYFQGTVDFDPSTSTVSLVSNGLKDIYIASYGAGNGVLNVSKAIGGSIDDEGTTIAVDASNNVYVGGYFENTASFDFTSTSQNKTSLGFWDAFIVKYSQSLSTTPTISSISPSAGAVGTTLTIAGTNFNATPANNIVYFGAVKATVTAATTNQLTVTVPSGATYGPITVTVNGLTAYSKKPFVSTFPGSGGIDLNSFAVKTDVTVGTTNFNNQLSVGDFDGDSKPDLAIADQLSNSISVIRNNSPAGSITFAPYVDFITGASPQGVAVADLDGDGKLDIVSINNSGNTVSAFRNVSTTGTITTSSFAPKVDFSTGTNPVFCAMGDLDADGKPDLAVTNINSNSVSIYKNTSTTGTINFATKIDLTTGTSPRSVAFGDIDGDGKLDLVITNYSSTSFSVFRNTSPGTITFAAKVDVSTGASINPSGLALGDLDADDKPEVIVTNDAGVTVSVFKNNSTPGSVTFATQVDLTAGTRPFSVTIGDLDGDTKPDLAVASNGVNTVSIFKNNSPGGTIAFAAKVDFATGAAPTSVVIDDLDGDGKPDLAVSNSLSPTVSILRNTISVTTAPIILSFNPTSGPVGSSVTITGSNFSSTTTSNTVKFNGTTAVVSVSTGTNITTAVPSGAITGPISVTVGGLTATSTSNFTITIAPLTITESFVTTYLKDGTSKARITVSNAAQVSSVKFWAKGITILNTYTSRVLTGSGNNFDAIFTTTELSDPIGLLYYFEVTDNSSNVIKSSTGSAYLSSIAGATEQAIPSLVFGDQVSSFQIISVPSVLTDKTVVTAFKALGSYSKPKWRLFSYTNGALSEYPAFTTVDPGKGYWFIAKTSPGVTGINVGAGTTVQVTEAVPFVMNLTAGWNLIGNPYNFRVSWQDVLTLNASTAGITGVGTLRVFNGGSLTNGTALEKFRGAFVKTNSAIALKIPVIKTLSGRVDEEKGLKNSIDQSQWEVNFILSNGLLSNHLGGIGMNPQAKLTGVDPFDEASFSLLDDFGMVSLAFRNTESFSTLDKDIVPTAGSHVWTVDVNRGNSENPVILSWNNDYYGDNDKKLVLFDPVTLHTVDMRRQNQYSLSQQTSKLRILFGTQEYIDEALDKELPLLGSAYPNPAQQRLAVPFRVPLSMEQAAVNISVFDSQGKVVATLVNGEYQKGNYEGVWNPEVTPGLYLIQFKLGTNQPQFQKIIIK